MISIHTKKFWGGLLVIGGFLSPASACEVAKILFGSVSLQILQLENDHESALVRNADFNNRDQNYDAIRGEITVDRGGFAVRNNNNVVVGTISPDMKVDGFDDSCDKTKGIVIRRIERSAYATVNGDTPVGLIRGRFPKNNFGVDNGIGSASKPGNSGAPSYIGRWVSEEDAKDPRICKSRQGEGIGLFVYSAKEVIAYEGSCKITNATQVGSKTQLTMRCSSEGETSTVRETVEVVDGKLNRTVPSQGRQTAITYVRCP